MSFHRRNHPWGTSTKPGCAECHGDVQTSAALPACTAPKKHTRSILTQGVWVWDLPGLSTVHQTPENGKCPSEGVSVQPPPSHKDIETLQSKHRKPQKNFNFLKSTHTGSSFLWMTWNNQLEAGNALTQIHTCIRNRKSTTEQSEYLSFMCLSNPHLKWDFSPHISGNQCPQLIPQFPSSGHTNHSSPLSAHRNIPLSSKLLKAGTWEAFSVGKSQKWAECPGWTQTITKPQPGLSLPSRADQGWLDPPQTSTDSQKVPSLPPICQQSTNQAFLIFLDDYLHMKEGIST